MDKEIHTMLRKSSSVIADSASECCADISKAVDAIAQCLKGDRKILLVGNGGSATQASHIAAEFTGRYELERNALPAIALTTDLAAVTSIANDYGYEKIFERQIEALGNKNDLLIALSTSGRSENINKGVKTAKKRGLKVISLIGKGGGEQKGLGDIDIIIPSDKTSHVQEVHLAVLHIICELVERRQFAKK
jgi:D-sedoheptulose 7-phosphate isomerase